MKPQRNPAVDAFIAAAPAYARPILVNVPSFEYKGILGGMAVFHRHVAFGFWKSRLMADFEETFGRPGRASAMGARVESMADLPSAKVLTAFVKEARRLNDEGIKEPKRAAVKRKVPARA